MITVIICSLFIGILVGSIIGACAASSSSSDFTYPLLEVERQRRQEADYKLASAEEELRRGCRNFRGMNLTYKCGHCYPCYACQLSNRHLHDWQCHEPRVVEKVVYAKSPNEQEVVDLLLKATPPLDELKKKFGIK